MGHGLSPSGRCRSLVAAPADAQIVSIRPNRRPRVDAPRAAESGQGPWGKCNAYPQGKYKARGDGPPSRWRHRRTLPAYRLSATMAGTTHSKASIRDTTMNRRNFLAATSCIVATSAAAPAQEPSADETAVRKVV